MDKNKFFYSFTLSFFLLLVVSGVQSQGTVEVILFRDNTGIAFYISASRDVVSLAEITLETVNNNDDRESYSFNDFTGFAGLTFSNLPTPVCLRLFQASAPPPAPVECREAQIFRHGLSDGNIFWYDPDFGHRIIFIRLANDTEVICASGENRCVFELATKPGIPSEPVPEGVVNQGIELLNAEMYSRAGDVFTELIRLQPNDASSYVLRALAHVYDKSYAEALNDYDQALTLDEENFNAWIGRGKTNLAAYHPQDAVQDFTRAVEIAPDTVDGYYWRAQAYRAAEEFELAIEEFLLAEEKGLTRELALAEIGWTHSVSGDYERALDSYNEAIDLSPDSAFLYQGRGTVYSEMGDYENAVDDYSYAIELETASDTGSQTEQSLTAPIGNTENAIEVLTEGIDTNPGVDLDILYCNRGTAYVNAGQFTLATADFELALEEDDRSVCAYEGLGSLYSDTGEYQQAVEILTKAIELDGTNATSYNNRGVAYANLGEYEIAAEDLSQAIMLEDDVALYYLNRAYVYSNLEETDLALDDYDHALVLDDGPDNAYAFNNRGIIYYSREQYEEAANDFRAAVERDGSDATYHLNLAYALLAVEADNCEALPAVQQYVELTDEAVDPEIAQLEQDLVAVCN